MVTKSETRQVDCLLHILSRTADIDDMKKVVNFCDESFRAGLLNVGEHDWSEMSSIAASLRIDPTRCPATLAGAIPIVDCCLTLIPVSNSISALKVLLKIVSNICNAGRDTLCRADWNRIEESALAAVDSIQQRERQDFTLELHKLHVLPC